MNSNLGRKVRSRSGAEPTLEQLRDDIDSGRTGDKVQGSDPAAVPLGTDDEAAGTTPTLARRREARDTQPAARPYPGERDRTPGAAWILIAAAAALLSVIILVWLLVRA